MLVSVTDFLWSYVLVRQTQALLIAMGGGLHHRIALVQVRYFGEMFRVLGQAFKHQPGQVSSFQALNLDRLPMAISLIYHSASGLEQAVGGGIRPGAVIRKTFLSRSSEEAKKTIGFIIASSILGCFASKRFSDLGVFAVS